MSKNAKDIQVLNDNRTMKQFPKEKVLEVQKKHYGGIIVMRKINLKKIITMGLITTSILAVAPVGASAEWRQSNNGWWYAEGNSYSRGWKNIGGSWYYFDNNGYMKAG